MDFERSEGSSRDEEDTNHSNNRNDDANQPIDIETAESSQHNAIQNNTSNRLPIQPIPSYAIALTRRNVTRIPVAKPIRWDKQDPPAAAPEQSIPLPQMDTWGCIVGSVLVTLLAWLLTAAVTFAYAFVVWNSILFLFGEGRFYDWAQQNNTLIEIEFEQLANNE